MLINDFAPRERKKCSPYERKFKSFQITFFKILPDRFPVFPKFVSVVFVRRMNRSSSFILTSFNQNLSTSIKEGLTIESYNNRRLRDLLRQSYTKIPEHYSYIKRTRHGPDDNADKFNI